MAAAATCYAPWQAGKQQWQLTMKNVVFHGNHKFQRNRKCHKFFKHAENLANFVLFSFSLHFDTSHPITKEN